MCLKKTFELVIAVTKEHPEVSPFSLYSPTPLTEGQVTSCHVARNLKVEEQKKFETRVLTRHC